MDPHKSCLAFFYHSIWAHSKSLGLPDFLQVSKSNFRIWEIQPTLRSTCPNHLILLVWRTTSPSWMPSFERSEWEQTLSFVLMLHIQRIMARSFHLRQFNVETFTGHVSAACNIALLTQIDYTRLLINNDKWRLARSARSWRNLAQAHLQRVIEASSHPPPADNISLR